jgi:hypothetical protein
MCLNNIKNIKQYFFSNFIKTWGVNIRSRQAPVCNVKLSQKKAMLKKPRGSFDSCMTTP